MYLVAIKHFWFFVSAEIPEDRAKCNVNGKIYRDGDWFLAEEDPNLSCVCQEGYKGILNQTHL